MNYKQDEPLPCVPVFHAEAKERKTMFWCAMGALFVLSAMMHCASIRIAERGQIYDFSYAEADGEQARATVFGSYSTPQNSPATTRPPRQVWVTTYADKYEGRKTKSGEVFTQAGLTCAVPRSEWKRLAGKVLTFSRQRGRFTASARVTDTVGPGVGNFDLSRAVWDRLAPGLAPSRIRAELILTEEP